MYFTFLDFIKKSSEVGEIATLELFGCEITIRGVEGGLVFVSSFLGFIFTPTNFTSEFIHREISFYAVNEIIRFLQVRMSR